MTSYAARYAAGDHEEVWRLLDMDLLPLEERYALFGAEPTPEDTEAVMRDTFGRVARNIDRLVERLRGIGYRFECETGRTLPAYAPRRAATADAQKSRSAVLQRFDDLPATAAGPFPLALTIFAEVVGSVDLRQENSDGSHPDSEDLVMARLGDWDPFEIDFSYLAYELTQPDVELEMAPLPEGGLALQPEFAASFEHKANISGAWNPNLRLPSYRIDPMVFAEGIALPFTTYLRRVFERGGFFGTPRPFFRSQEPGGYLEKSNWPPVREVEPGIWLPDHPIFADLARDLEPF